MPTYDYVCEACDHEFELFQSMTAPVKRKCPACGKQKLKRLIGTGAAVIFKGGGFYETDYRSESYKKAAESEKKSSEKSSDRGTDAKPAKKDGAKTGDAAAPAAKKDGGANSASGGTASSGSSGSTKGRQD